MKKTLVLIVKMSTRVNLTAAPEVRVRLINGSVPSEGRVMLTVRNKTGTVCDDFFTDMEARVICQMLGYR